VSHPNPNIDFSPFLPQAGMTAPPPSNTYPYNENYFFSIERQLGADTLLSVSYVGSQAHSPVSGLFRESRQPSAVPGAEQAERSGSGSPTCGPFVEDSTYITAGGQIVEWDAGRARS